MPQALTGLRAALAAMDRPALKIKGSKALLARKINLTRAAVGLWGNVIPLPHVARVAKVTGVPVEILRPDYAQAVERATRGLLKPARRRTNGRQPHR